MPDHLNARILLVGAGPMAEAYANVLTALGEFFTVVGRGEGSARRLQLATGAKTVTGGIKNFCDKADISEYTHAIIAVGVEDLAAATIIVLGSGIRNVLVEKPAGLDRVEIERVAGRASACCAKVFVAYNRRFYASTRALSGYVERDGGVRSFIFEFTEWSEQICALEKPERVKANWLLANSSHVIDLAFHIGGVPDSIRSFSGGALAWHPRSVFAGAGHCRSGALFAYHANWDAPGRWGLEVLTREHRLILRPLEILQVQKRASTTIEALPIEDEVDKRFKPGVFEQVRAFLGENEMRSSLCRLEEHLGNVRVCEVILNGYAERDGRVEALD